MFRVLASLRPLAKRSFVALAAVMLFTLAACGNGSTKGAPVQITYTYTDFAGNQADLSAVQDAINAILLPKLNITVKLNDIPYASYDQKTKLLFTAGTPCDAIFTASWTNVYTQNVAQGDFLDITDMLQQVAPQTYASLPASAWNGVKINGKIYAVINQQLFGEFWGAILRKDLATKDNLDLSGVKSYADLTPILAALKAKEPGITPLYSDDQFGGLVWHPDTFGYDSLSNVADVGIKANDTSLQSLNLAASPEYLQAAQLAYQWHQAGYYTKDPAPAADATAAFKAGKYAILLDQARADEPAKFKAAYGYDSVQALIAQPLLTTSTLQGTMNAVCRSSQHPKEALAFLNELNTNKDVYNLITHGIAGKDYTVTNAAQKLITVPKDSGYNPNTDWMFGNQFNAFYTDAAAASIDLWSQEAAANKSETASAMLGFNFDSSKVKTQVAQITSADKQYGAPILKGLVDPTTAIPQYLKALKDAGIDQVIAEVQTQLTAWKAANGK